MRFWLFIALAVALLGREAVAQQPFLKNIQLSSTEVYQESTKVFVPGDDPTLVAEYRFTVDITSNISSADALLFNEDTPFKISVGNFSIGEIEPLTLGMDEDFDSTVPGKNRTAKFSFETFDINSDTFAFGVVTVDWTALDTLTVRVAFNTMVGSPAVRYYLEPGIEPDYWLWAYTDLIANAPNPDVNDTGFAEFTFGPYTQPLLTFFVKGNSTVTGDDSLIRVALSGGTDSISPTSTILAPAPTATLVASPSIFEGTTKDTFRVGSTTYPSLDPPEVQFFLSDSKVLPADPDWTDATVSDTTDPNGNWTWQSPVPVDLNPGVNYLFTKITDSEGNVTQPIYRQFQYSTKGVISLTGAASGFPAGDAGKIVGTVSGSGSVFPKPKTISVKVNASPTPLSDTRNNVEAGNIGIATAKPGASAIFNGWTATFDGAPFALSPQEAVKEKLMFFTRPKLVIIGNFAPNPFLQSGVGTYFGVIGGASAGERGVFQGKITKTGTFSGKLKIGVLTLPVKGKFLGSGLWTGTIVKKGKTYTITLNASVAQGAAQQITGTVSSEGIESSITSDLSIWKKRINEATAYEGYYNVLLPATGSVPEGIGYGRVSVSKLGKVKFIGKTGNATPMSFSTFLYKRSETEVVFPFFFALEKKLGNIAGTVIYDSSQPNSDLTGTLTWYKPATTKLEPEEIDGQIALHGSKYVRPANGTRVMLGATGAGAVKLRGPSFTTPPTGTTAFLSAAANLQTDNSLAPVADSPSVQKLALKFSSATGLFSGKFFDPALRKTFSFSGAATQKANAQSGAAGGVFIRGNRTGFVSLTPPVP